ncbi:alpha/beta hydrolase family protein [Streptomyces sp. NBC_01335]|uniref:alpha/beta hydrolase n=1 Tax=Streptomyces sp. NBC_01335 TaxID=2903828 RepID=UPI002E150AA3|nr:alpha/beta hydrolase family protein [Streptomyces sp. NBC_01335]
MSTVVGVINVLTLASSVDAVDGQLLGVLLYAALPGIVGLVLSFYARIHGRGVWFGLVAVHVWLVLGSLATLGAGDVGVSGLPQLVMPVAVVVLLFRPAARGWFRLARAERDVEPRFRVRGLRLLVARRDGGQTAMEYLGLVLIVAALVGAIMATTVGTQLTGEIRNAICQLTGGACSSPGSDVVAGGRSGEGEAGSSGGPGSSGGSGGSAGSGGSGGSSGAGGSAAAGGTQTGTEGATGALSGEGSDTAGSATTAGSTSSAGSDTGTGGTGTGGTGGTGTGGTGSGDTSTTGTSTAGTSTAGTPTTTKSTTPGNTKTPGFFESLVGDGLGGDLRGAAKAIGSPVKSVTGVVDQWSELTGAAREKWASGDHAGAIGAWVEASGGVGVGGMGLPGSGPRVVAAVREDERQYLNDRIPVSASAAGRKAWWDGLSQADRGRYLELSPERIGNLDGIPAAVRDQANRQNLQTLITELEGKDDKKSKQILEGMKEIDRQLKEGSQPPMFLLGIGSEGNGRAIVSYGNPDLSQHVSAYVPGLNTSLDKDFAQNDLKRARDTAIGAQGYESSSASIVWLGYDAPQLPDSDGIAGYFAIMGTGRAEKGGTAYDDFWSGLTATNTNKDPHFTAIGHSYGSRTVGAATQREGGIPGVDDIILVGSPGVGVDNAVELGVGARHVFVGAAANDPVTKLPSKTQAVVGSLGMLALGPAGAYVAGDLADPGDDDLWFGKDPASKAFGAVRFPVDPGPPVISGHGISAEAHSQYFDPVRDAMSADAIALIVSGHSSNLKIEEQR